MWVGERPLFRRESLIFSGRSWPTPTRLHLSLERPFARANQGTVECKQLAALPAFLSCMTPKCRNLASAVGWTLPYLRRIATESFPR